MNTDLHFEGVVYDGTAKQSYHFSLIEDPASTQGISINGRSYRVMSNASDSEGVKKLFFI
jgi:hypothetical protein